MSTTRVRGDTTRTGLVIEHLERIADSVNGYPRFRVHFTDGTIAQTMSAWHAGYCIENAEYRGVPLTVTFTVHGKIRHAQPSPGYGDEERTPEELAYQRAQIAAGFGDPYARD